MASIRVAIDKINSESSDIKTLNTFAQKLRDAGHTVTTHGRGPNKIQRAMQSKSNACDLMIQVAGGKCIGTLCDFHLGIKRGSYHAKAGGFAYFKCYKADWNIKRAKDDNFSHSGAIKREVDQWLGKHLPEVYKAYPEMYMGYGDTAEDCAKTFLQSYSGSSGSTTSTTTAPAGRAGLDILNEICTDWNPYGVERTLRGDTIVIKRTNPNTAVPLDESMIINNSVSFTDYDVSTPNTFGDVKDQYLVDRFGQIPLDDEGLDTSWASQVLQMAQRGHEHSIDLKVISNPNFVEGRWVLLSLKRYGIQKRPYYISKSSVGEERVTGLTLESGPPQMYVEKQPVIEEASTEETTEEES